MQVKVGNILDVTEGVIIQQVNAMGYMGSGVARAIRNKYPTVFDDYAATVPIASANVHQSRMGKVILSHAAPKLIVANLVGQLTTRAPGDPDGVRYTSYDSLDGAFTELAKLLRGLPVSLHMPLLGSDLGGGHWPVVKAIAEFRLRDFDTTLWLLPGVVEPA